MTLRKLASVQVVESVSPISFINDAGETEIASNIEHIQVLAWHLVAQKGQFNPGDMCVYVEYDALLPEKPEYEFMRKCCFIDKNGFKGFLVKTKKMRGMISQGLALTMDVLPAGTYSIGDDVTKTLGIVKYDPPLPACLGGIAAGLMPSEVPTPDEERIHAVPGVLERNRGKRVYATLKCDGSAASYIMQNNQLRVCSKNLELVDTPTNTFWRIAKRYDLVHKMREYAATFGDFAVQGELVGPGIRKNRHGLAQHDLYVYSVFSLRNNKYIRYSDAQKVATDLGLKFVPFIGEFDLEQGVSELEDMAYGPDLINPAKMREGIVIRPVEEDTDIQLGRLSFKVLPPKSLI